MTLVKLSRFFVNAAAVLLAAFIFLGCPQLALDYLADIAWTAQADGGDAVASTRIDFVFDRALADLSADAIAISDGTGRAAKGALAGNGKEWSLGITVEAPGDVIVSINKDGVDSGEQILRVHKAPLIAWTLVADGVDGARDSTALVIAFSREIEDLSADHITVAEDTGRLVKGALAGSGTEWSLGISVETAGNVSVSIQKEGIETAAKKIAVYKAGQTTNLAWTARADGIAGKQDSTLIAFSFSGEAAGLAAEHITLADDTGSVVKGALAGGGTEWSLEISVETAGDLTVSIQKEGIETAAKKIAVYKAGQTTNLTWTARANGAAGAGDSTAIAFELSGAAVGLTADDISVVNDTGAVEKGALSGGGANWSLAISVIAAGDVKVRIRKTGIEEREQTVAVHQAPAPGLIAYDAAADGGSATASTKIDFTFSAAPADLTAEDISIVNDTGAVTKGALAGGGTSWSLGIAVTAAGNVKVKISKTGVEDTEKTLSVHKAPDSPEGGGGITYDAAADGGATTDSSKINFTFSAAPADLTAEDISIVNDTGAVTKGALAGGGASWSLGIAVTAAGHVKVRISREGIEDTEKTVAVHKVPGIAYSAVADGADNTATSTKIDFAFNAAVAGLTAADLSVTNGTGAVMKGALTGSGTHWSLGITVTAPGNVTVKINKAGIEAAEKTLTVHKAPIIAYTLSADGANNTTASTKIDFAFSAAVADLTAADIIVANGTGAAAKGALTGDGAGWSLGIAVSAPGELRIKILKPGIEDTEKTVTVHQAPDPAATIAYTAAADGDPGDSAKIDFVFSEPVESLAAGNISITNGTGAAAKGALTGSGTHWSLGIVVSAPGNVRVRINRAGIEGAEKTVTLYKQLITYTAAADIQSGAEPSGSIDLSFSRAVEGLSIEDIGCADDTGSAYPLELTGSGRDWSLGIVVISSGNIRISIDRDGIEGEEKIVAVYKPEEAPPVVKEKTGITVISPPDTVIYAKNQTFDRTGLVIGWAYSDGTAEPMLDGSYTIEAPNMGVSTLKRVIVRAGSYETSFFIQVLNTDKALSSITVEGPTKKIQDLGVEFDKTGLVVTGHYSDGSTSNLTSLAAIVDYDRFKRGPQAPSVKVNGKTAPLEGITTRIGEAAAVSGNRYFGSQYDMLKVNYKDVYVKGEAITPRGSNIQIVVSPSGYIYGADAFYLTLDNGGLTEEDFATLTGYNPDQTGWQRPSLTIDGRQVSFHVRVIDTEAAVWFDYGYMRHDGDPTGHGPGAGKYYAKPNETLVIAPVRYLLGYNADHSDAGASYAWTVSGGDSSRTWTTSSGGELLHIRPKIAGTYTITVAVTGREYVSGSSITKTAATELVCYGSPLPAGDFVSPLRNFAPGQFTTGGNGYGWSLGAAGGYEVWAVEPQSSYNIEGNPFGVWQEAGVVWMQEDNNGNGLPDEIWYELRGGDDDDSSWKNYVTRRYAIMYIKGDGTNSQHGIPENNYNRAAYWVDNRGRSGLMDNSSFPSSVWGVDGSWVTYTCTLLRDNGNITGGYSNLAPMYGYADANDWIFYVNRAMGVDGASVTLTAVKFIKVQTGVLRYGGLYGDVSTEIQYADFLGTQSSFPKP
jgi:hypothetical protein